jgi:hypothetical protein
LYEVLTKEFGLSDVELDEIAKNREVWTDERIRETIEFVRHRCATSKVNYPGKYLMTAIRWISIRNAGKRILESHKVATKVKEQRDLELQAIRDMSPAPAVTIPSGVA